MSASSSSSAAALIQEVEVQRSRVNPALEKYTQAVAALRDTNQRDARLYDQVRYIVLHGRQFTPEQIQDVRSLARSYPWFTQKQQAEIANSMQQFFVEPQAAAVSFSLELFHLLLLKRT